MTFTCIVRSNSSEYYDISKWITNHLKKDGINLDKMILSDIYMGDIPSTEYILPEGSDIDFKFNNKPFKVSNRQITKDYGTAHTVMCLYELSIIGSSKEDIDKLLFAVMTRNEPNQIRQFMHERWSKLSDLQKRSFDTIILEDGIKEKIVKDLEIFVNSEKDYIKYGIPYKRNYLFHGKPGTGKTSLVTAMANHLRRSIYIISFDISMTNDLLHKAINSMLDENVILLLEDIDCIFTDRSTETNSHVSFSALLNVLDGVGRQKKLITVITTNHVEKLDPALVRPGRIDMMIGFDICTGKQLANLFTLYNRIYSKENLKNIENLVKEYKLTPSSISGFLFRQRNVDLTDENLLKYFDQYLKEILIDRNKIDRQRQIQMAGII
jgi:hypothetical protein